jgi:hypothetical protein
MLSQEIEPPTRIGQGRNNQVYEFKDKNHTRYIAKFYYRHPCDPRDRLNTEFGGLRFLWANGMRCIPKPILASKEHGCAVYGYIDGETITPLGITDADIHQAAQFLVDLKTLSQAIGSNLLPSASEACFSAQDILTNIEFRRKALLSLPWLSRAEETLFDFLQHEFSPGFNVLTSWAKSKLVESGNAMAAELPYRDRTLSPSDFGFHNALRMSDGHIVFLDFEYFGWDDPVKMIADFLLHPGMQLGAHLRKEFMRSLFDAFGDEKALRARLKIYYPLLGLNWCLILLNEFDPEHRRRRSFSKRNSLPIGEIKNRQLEKAKRMFSSIMQYYAHFEPFYSYN